MYGNLNLNRFPTSIDRRIIHMAYTHLIMKEIAWIETYRDLGHKTTDIARKLKRSNQTVYNVVNFFERWGNSD